MFPLFWIVLEAKIRKLCRRLIDLSLENVLVLLVAVLPWRSLWFVSSYQNGNVHVLYERNPLDLSLMVHTIVALDFCCCHGKLCVPGELEGLRVLLTPAGTRAAPAPPCGTPLSGCGDTASHTS